MNAALESLTLTAAGQGVGMVALAVIAVILFTVILTTLRRAGMFSSGVNLTLAICVSLLAVMGIMRTFGPSTSDRSGSEGRGWLDFILLPYTAMAIAILLLLLLLLFWRSSIGRRLTRRWTGRGTCEQASDSAPANDKGEKQEPRGQAGWGE